MTKFYPQMSDNQESYVAYIFDHPGCCIMDVVRACKRNPLAGHKWVYAGVHRLAAQNIITIESSHVGGRTELFAIEK